MKPDQSMALGLYRLHWVSGGSSLASVGMLHDGSRWYAAANWSSAEPTGIASSNWDAVEHAELVLRHSRDSELPEISASEALVLLAETVVTLTELGIHISASKDVTRDRVPALMRAAELAATCRLRHRVSMVVPSVLLDELGRALHEAGLFER